MTITIDQRPARGANLDRRATNIRQRVSDKLANRRVGALLLSIERLRSTSAEADCGRARSTTQEQCHFREWCLRYLCLD